ncbi:hypothetical protein D3C72_1491130 [compost metagenome]
MRIIDFAMQSHLVVGHASRYHQPRLLDLRVAARDFMHLRWMHEHGAHLGGLIGASHPAFDARIRAPARRLRRIDQHGRQIARGKADQRIVGIEDGDDDFAHFTRRDGNAAARVDDFQQHVLVDHHARIELAIARRFIGDAADIGRGIGLEHVRHAVRGKPAAQGFGQGFGAHHGLGDAADVGAHFARFFDDQF